MASTCYCKFITSFYKNLNKNPEYTPSTLTLPGRLPQLSHYPWSHHHHHRHLLHQLPTVCD